jgi:hypothetical protein
MRHDHQGHHPQSSRAAPGRLRWPQWPIACLLAASLAACGGGGSGIDPDPQSSVTRDATLPFVTRIEPANQATGFDLNGHVVVTFSEEMDASRLTAANLMLTQGGIAVAGTITIKGNSVTFIPQYTLQPVTEYTMRISRNVTDLAGNGLSGNEGIITPNDFVWRFTTGSTFFQPTF